MLLDKRNGNTYVVDEKGNSGETTSEMIKRLGSLLEANPKFFYSIIIILGGTNDLSREKSFQIAANITELHKIAHQFCAKTVLITIPPIVNLERPLEAIRKEVNQDIKKYALDYPDQMVIVDLDEYISPKQRCEDYSRLYDDLVHFTPKGYDKLGEIIFKAIEHLLV